MMTVVDHARPWLRPSSTFATMIQDQFGAQITRKGTGSPKSQAATRTCLRPYVSLKPSGEEIGERLDRAKGGNEGEHRTLAGHAELRLRQ